MNKAYFLFHGRLNDFLPQNGREQRIVVDFHGRQSVKHLTESLGAPHTEVGRVYVNGRQEALDHIPQDGDEVELHPIENGALSDPRFLLDCHLGRLTAHLRMLGFDCLYRNDYEDAQLARLAHEEQRILLTRDRRLLMRKIIQQGYCLRSLDPLEQLSEVILRFDLANKIQPFHRCLRCNHPLETVEKETILDRLEPLTKKYFDEFHLCPACGRIYWKGSHYERMRKLIEQITWARQDEDMVTI